jgi:hypothetical protein
VRSAAPPAVLPLLALVLMVCVYHLPQLLTGTVQFDGVDVHYSAQRYLSDELHAGRLPFWTPYIFNGFPFLADLQVGAWYPLNWPFILAGIGPHSIGGELLMHSMVACAGAYLLALRLLREPVAAVGAALFYGLSGYFAAHSQHVGLFETAAWLPWLVLLVLEARERLTWRVLGLGALLGAALALPGHFQTALYAVTGVAVWGLLEAALRRSGRQAGRVLVCLLAVGVWGGAIAAVMVLPAAELAQASIRAQFEGGAVGIGYFHPASLLTLVWPDFYGLLSGHYTGPGDSTQHYFYAGLLFVPLIVLGLAWAKDRSRVVGLAILLGVPFLWYALGPPGVLYRVVTLLPGFRGVELPMHGWFLPALGLAVLGGLGLTRVPPRWRWPIVLLVFADMLYVNQLRLPLAYARGSFDQLYGTTLQAFADQLGAARPPVERIFGQPLSQVAYRNHALQSRVETTYGYNPLELAGYAAYADAAERNSRLIAGFAPSHGLIVPPPSVDAGTSPTLEPLPDTSRLPLAYFARQVRAVPDDGAARAALEDLDPASETIVTGPLPPELATAGATSTSTPPAVTASPLPARTASPNPAATSTASSATRAATVTHENLDSLTIHYQTATPALLRVAIPAYPGWHATVVASGEELQPLTADAAFMGIVVPAGEADLHLQYQPTTFRLAAIVSALALLAALAAAVRPTSTRTR